VSLSPYSSKSAASGGIEIQSFSYPLDYCYHRQAIPFPNLEAVPPGKIPEPVKSLLVHQKDMTPTLEAFHGDRIFIEVLHRDYSAGHYFREVVLRLEQTQHPVEFGAIRIFLEHLPTHAREAILKERLPLGHILAEHQVAHKSNPIGYLRMAPDALISRVLSSAGQPWLYGRRNRLSNPAGQSIAEIIEILPNS
jgi:chorismate-pyruvate lyase